jgi:hypothetical protein
MLIHSRAEHLVFFEPQLVSADSHRPPPLPYYRSQNSVAAIYFGAKRSNSVPVIDKD